LLKNKIYVGIIVHKLLVPTRKIKNKSCYIVKIIYKLFFKLIIYLFPFGKSLRFYIKNRFANSSALLYYLRS